VLIIAKLIKRSLPNFLIFLLLREGLHILFHCFLSVPRDLIYNYLEIKFSKAVIKDLYHKITEMPAIAFENIGVGEFINRMTTDPDRVMDLLGRLIKMTCRAVVVLIVLVLAFANSIFLGMAMAALGMSVNFKVIFQRGKAVFGAAAISSTVLLVLMIVMSKVLF